MRRLCWLATVASLGPGIRSVAYLLVAGLVDECRQLIDGAAPSGYDPGGERHEVAGPLRIVRHHGKAPCQLVGKGIKRA
jgi:hypothetical protein